MASLWDQLTELLPAVLAKDPEKAVNGTKLMERIRPKLKGEYSDATIRQHFSMMAQEPTSPIAKVATGHGYYLRKLETLATAPKPSAEKALVEAESKRDLQLEEKFRAVFIRYAEQQNLYPVHIEHTKSKNRPQGVNRWKFPDVVTVQWGVGEVTDSGFRLDPNMLAVKASLGEQPFTLQSAELKVGLSIATFRENFFQCVSNSKWAHHATLAVANPIADETLIDELRRLGSSYDITILTYGLSEADLESVPTAEKIKEMPLNEFDESIGARINVSHLSTGKARPTLDWDHISDLRKLNGDFSSIFEWVSYCLSKGKAYSYSEFKKIQEIEKRHG